MTQAWLTGLKDFFNPSARRAPSWEEQRETFFRAVRKDDAETVRKIAAQYPGESVTWSSEDGSPLRVAQQRGHLNTFKALLDLGADMNETYHLKQRHGSRESSPLYQAIEKKQRDFAVLLLDRGADREKHDHAFENPPFSPLMRWTDATPLAAAIRQGDKEAVILLLEKGADARGFCYKRDYVISDTGAQSPATYAAGLKGRSVILDLVKRADIIRAEYLALHPEAAPKAAEPAPETAAASAPAETPAAAPEKKNPSLVL